MDITCQQARPSTLNDYLVISSIMETLVSQLSLSRYRPPLLVTMVAVPTGYKIVIPRTLRMHGIY